MKLLKAFGGAGALVVAAIVGGTLISSVLAAPAATSTDAPALADADGTYCQAYRDALAAELGISVDELTAAGTAAATTTIDAAVAAGDLTEERATALKERIAAHAGEWCALLGGRLHPGGPGGPGVRGMLPLGDLLGVAADTLGLEQGDLVDRLRAGETLADIATAEGVDIATVTGAVTDALDTALADAVAAGDLAQARADEIAAHVAAELADGTWPDHPGRGHGWHGRGDAPDAEATPAS
jgi:hypothetical protein